MEPKLASEMTQPWKPELQLTQEDGKLYVRCTRSEDPEIRYRFALERDGVAIHRYPPSFHHTACYWMDQPGSYVVKVRIDRGEETLTWVKTDPVVYEGRKTVVRQKIGMPSFASGVSHTLRELSKNWGNVLRLSLYTYRSRNKDSRLGKLWSIINPLIQILTYWFVFGIGLRNGQPVDGHPFLIWMLCGIIPWFFISTSITEGSNAIYSNASMVLRMNYPLSTLPLQKIFAAFIEHLVTLALLLIISVCFGYPPTLHWLNLLYYQLYSLVFLYALSLITSTLTMMARDYQKLLLALIRLLFYVTPILWTLNRLPAATRKILKLNPILYIVSGYRDSILYGQDFWTNKKEIVFFWGIALLLMLCGTFLFERKRDRFSDML